MEQIPSQTAGSQSTGQGILQLLRNPKFVTVLSHEFYLHSHITSSELIL
jgi:hypothetical protein